MEGFYAGSYAIPLLSNPVEPIYFLVEKDFAFNLAAAFDHGLSKTCEEKQQIGQHGGWLLRSDR